jgi:hypothetical protein
MRPRAAFELARADYCYDVARLGLHGRTRRARARTVAHRRQRCEQTWFYRVVVDDDGESRARDSERRVIHGGGLNAGGVQSATGAERARAMCVCAVF